MIDVRGIANGLIQGVNPDVPATLKVNIGFTTDENYRQVPDFENYPVDIQPQSLKSSDKYHLKLIDRQGDTLS